MAATLQPTSIAGRVRATLADCPHKPNATELRARVLLAYPELDSENPKVLLTACARELRASEDESDSVWRTEAAQLPSDGVEVEAEPAPVANVSKEGNGVVIEFPASQSIKTLDELLTAADFDPALWRVERHIINKWDTHAVIDKSPVCLPNWQVKAWLKPVEHVTSYTVAEIAKVLAPLVRRDRVGFRPKQTDEHANYLLEIDIFDLHLGKKADVLESGEHYDLETACHLYDTAIDTLLARANGYPIGTVLLPVGNDFYNSDTMIGSTTKGTPQHEAARWQRTFVTGSALIIGVVNRIRERGLKVKLVTVPGNHDFANVFYLGQVLEATFSECADVEIDNTFPPRKYVQFHDCAIMYTHGNEEKEVNLPMLFAQEQPHIWAATRFREAHLAHIHHKKEFKYRTMGENIGMTVRYMRSLSAADAWHFNKGYVGSQRSAEAFIWAKGEGVVGHLTYTYSPVNHLMRTAA